MYKGVISFIRCLKLVDLVGLFRERVWMKRNKGRGMSFGGFFSIGDCF